jgi:hypothetical protein
MLITGGGDMLKLSKKNQRAVLIVFAVGQGQQPVCAVISADSAWMAQR